jgi:preprotein translocase subunit YajC
MLTLFHSLATVHALVFASTKKSSSSGSATFLFILLILAVGAFLFIRPQRRRQKEQQAMQQSIGPGDEVVTTSGIVGRVQSMNDDRVRLEIAPGTTIEIVRRAVGQRVSQAWQADSSSGNTQWDVPASHDDSSQSPPPTDTTGENAAEKWGFPEPSPKPDPDEDSSAGGSTGGSG